MYLQLTVADPAVAAETAALVVVDGVVTLAGGLWVHSPAILILR